MPYPIAAYAATTGVKKTAASGQSLPRSTYLAETAARRSSPYSSSAFISSLERRETVKFHLSNVYRMLQVSNRTEAARWAQLHGLVETPQRDRRPHSRFDMGFSAVRRRLRRWLIEREGMPMTPLVASSEHHVSEYRDEDVLSPELALVCIRSCAPRRRNGFQMSPIASLEQPRILLHAPPLATNAS